ncbi:MFS transporter [Pseudovibrio sp. Ad37]|uniref:MFS transporter n=1 Tax=Pseudovibrio sp. Ad37 TaxID=989422 RepID=UPI0007AE5EF8|nr:MFS transporter [Pseudovibrio sp. Ad37]KZL13487.1 Major Facilitator Superfamily protein [Pseudovibrio sp. Ad37]
MKNKSLLLVIVCLNVSAWVDLISIMTYIGYELEFSAIAVALVSISMLTPLAVFSGIISKTTKRRNPNHLLLITTATRALCTLCLIWSDTLITLLPLLRSMAIGFYQPIIAGEAQRTDPTRKAQFAALLNLINTLSKVIVPALGGILAVHYGEQAVFILSFTLCCVALLGLLSSPLSNQQPTQTVAVKQSISGEQIPLLFLTGFACCIVISTGLSLTFSNLLPYTFNYYAIPKTILSISLSASALAAILFNLTILRQKLIITAFPQTHLMASCILSAAAFGCLSLTLLQKTWYWILIPLLFSVLSVARAYFETFSNAYIFSCNNSVSVTLAAFKQSFSAYSGIVVTLLGAVSLTKGEPFAFLISISAIGFVLAIIWGRWDFQKTELHPSKDYSERLNPKHKKGPSPQ